MSVFALTCLRIQGKGDVVRVSGPQHESPPTSLQAN